MNFLIRISSGLISACLFFSFATDAAANVPAFSAAAIHGKGHMLWKAPPATSVKRLRSRAASPGAKREARDVLTMELAQRRAQQIERVDYRLEFEFAKQAAGYNGKVKIVARLRQTSEPLSLDAQLTRIDSVLVNGRAIADYVSQEGSLEIPAAHLAPDTTIEITYFNAYSQTGQGLIHFLDPVDNREYIFTDLEPYGAHTYFPCFDQPDLKASYDLTLKLPEGWRGISNALPTNGKDKGIVHFEPTLRVSTYLFFVGAGDYHVWRSEWNGKPLTVYARESLKDFVDADINEIFDITKRGLTFFSDYFAYSYPFPKYDHIFVPEFGPGAMENPGAVTMNERMIFRGPQPAGERMNRSNTILHEMAHHWFGDLVTMKWWDDLWLNEAFATYMGSLSQERALGLGEDAWISFVGEKNWAYWQDQLVTTHPIVANVADTDASGTLFDGITYGKGASVLKQLNFYVGEQAFQNGVRAYFQANAWGNAVRSDFVGSVANAFGASLEPWSRGWLETAGLNRAQPEWSCSADGLLATLAIRQQPTTSGLYLDHRSRLALYRLDAAGVPKLLETRDVSYSGEWTPLALGFAVPACPDFVLLNADDQDYALSTLDPASSALALRKFETFSDPLTRNLIWGALYQQVTDAQLPLNDFLGLAARALPRETNELLLSSWIGRYSNLRDLYWYNLTPTERDQLAPAIEAGAWASFTTATAESSAYYYWLDHYIEVAHTPEARARLYHLLNSDSLDQDRRWKVIVRLAGLGKDVARIIQLELERDPSDSGKKQAYAARVARPDLSAKQQAWRELTDMSTGLTMGTRREGSKRFYDADHPELAREFVTPFFEMIRDFDWNGEMFLMQSIFENLFPSVLCSQELLDRSRAELDAQSANLVYGIRRAWLEANDGLERCIRIRARNQLR